MLKPKHLPRDPFQRAKAIVDIATGQAPEPQEGTPPARPATVRRVGARPLGTPTARGQKKDIRKL